MSNRSMPIIDEIRISGCEYEIEYSHGGRSTIGDVNVNAAGEAGDLCEIIVHNAWKISSANLLFTKSYTELHRKQSTHWIVENEDEIIRELITLDNERRKEQEWQ